MANDCLITIGSFDGVHLGHAALLERAKLEAKRRRLKTVALTFTHPPRMVLDSSKRVPLLSTQREKEYWIRSLGIAEVEFLKFDKQFSRITAFGFFRDILCGRFNAKGIVVGSDFRFGLGRSAGATELVRWGQEFEIPVWVISAVKINGSVVSSTGIRQALSNNHFKKALSRMGHSYLIEGRVMRGQGIGKQLGFPTANLSVSPEKLLPRGVYAIRGRLLKGKRISINNSHFWPGVCNIGTRPTFSEKKKVVLEAHFFKKNLSLRGKTIVVELLRQLRREKKFKNAHLLTRAIANDVKAAKRVFMRSVKGG